MTKRSDNDERRDHEGLWRAAQMTYLDRLVQETSGHQRGIGCYVARHNRRHPDRPVSHNKDFELSRAVSMRGGRRATSTDAARWSLEHL